MQSWPASGKIGRSRLVMIELKPKDSQSDQVWGLHSAQFVVMLTEFGPMLAKPGQESMGELDQVVGLLLHDGQKTNHCPKRAVHHSARN